jgi:hypothetical protein
MASPSTTDKNGLPPKDAPTAARGQTSKGRLSNFLRDWFVYRFPAALTWFWIILRFTGRGLPFKIPLDRDYLVIPFLIAWVVLILARGWLRAIFYLPYLLTFPLLILIAICWWIFLFFKSTLVVPVQAFRIARSGAAIFVTFMAIVVGWAITLMGSRPSTRAAAALAAHTGTYLLFLQSFRWASNPYRPLLAIIEFLSEKGRKFFENTYINPGMKDAGDKRNSAIKACNWCLKWLDKLYQAKAPLKQGLMAFTYGNLLPSFIYGFIVIYCVLALSFSVTLYEIERAWGPIVSGLGSPTTSLSYFYFSFLTQATAIPSDVRPLSAYGQLWILWLVMTGILLLTILIASFTTSLGVHGGNALTEVRAFSESARQDLIRWQAELSQPVIEAEVVSSKVVPNQSSEAGNPEGSSDRS